jgi:hypothetical protein
MANLNEIPPFPNPGVRLIKEDEHVAIWEEIFEAGKPTPPHRHMRDYVAIFPNAGELTLKLLAGDSEKNTIVAGHVEEFPAEKQRNETGFYQWDSHPCSGARGWDWTLCGERRVETGPHDFNRN